MNRIYLAVAVLVIIPLFSGIYTVYTETRCKEISGMITESADGYGEKSGEIFEGARKKWEKLEKVLAVSANHAMLERVNESFIKAEKCLKLGEKNLFLVEAEWLSRLVEHVSETEKIKPYNIF